MDSSDFSLLQQDRLASVRTRNKTLITIIFSLIYSLVLIIIISFVLKSDFNSKSPNTNPAVQEFCSASGSKLSCVASLSSYVKTTRHTNPTLVYTLSLEAALQKLSYIDSIVSRSDSDVTRVDSALKNSWSSLRVAMRRLYSTLEVMRVNPDIETQPFELRRSMILRIEHAMEALRSCFKDFGKTGSTVVERVHEVEVLLRNSRDFLENFDWVSVNFQANGGYWSTRKILENVACVSFLGLQYLVLLFLFCLLLIK